MFIQISNKIRTVLCEHRMGAISSVFQMQEIPNTYIYIYIYMASHLSLRVIIIPKRCYPKKSHCSMSSLSMNAATLARVWHSHYILTKEGHDSHRWTIMVIISKLLKPEIIQKVHYVHQEIDKCRLRTKRCVFWHGINNNIAKIV